MLASGKYFSVFEPDINVIDINDIAIGLSNSCRFGCQIERYYSVAEHSVLASRLVSPENALCALLHDASEAYLHDLPRPIKERMPEYRALENSLMKVIAQRFEIPFPFPSEVKEVDDTLLNLEHMALRKKLPPVGEGFECLDCYTVRTLFLDRFVELTGNRL